MIFIISRAPTEMEYLLKNVKLDKAENHDLYVRATKANKFDSITLPDHLPPLPVKPQGPFREPLDVRKQRYRPFSPSLRVETDFESLEKARRQLKSDEWTQRLHDETYVYHENKSIRFFLITAKEFSFCFSPTFRLQV
jgi:hypothetical protein